MRISEIKALNEDTTYNVTIIRHLVEYICSEMPKTIPEDDREYIELSIHTFRQYAAKNHLSGDIKDAMLDVLGTLNGIALINTEDGMGDTAMGYFKTMGTHKSIGMNVSGLMGDSTEKTKEQVINFQGDKSLKNFKSVLGHELRHAVQDLDYSSNLKDPNSDDYDYHTDPLEIDASFMEALLDYDIDDYDDIQEYTNDVLNSFKSKKPLSDKNVKFYYRKIAKFFTMYKHGDPDVKSLKDRLDHHRRGFYEKFISGLDTVVAQINDEFSEKIANDFKKLGSIPKDDRQSYYLNIPNYATQRTLLLKVLKGEADSLRDSNVHLLVTTIAYVNTISSVPHYRKAIEKLYKNAESNISYEDTVKYIDEHGYFKKDAKYLEPMISALKNISN